MVSDPHLYSPYTRSEHERLVRTVQRDRLVDHLHPWSQPLSRSLAALRLALGGGVIHVGQRLQGTPAAATPSAGHV